MASAKWPSVVEPSKKNKMETMENNQELKPNYYAIIPACVRYSSALCGDSKLLYGEISSLCNKEGYCWANNNYFSKLYNVDVRTIQRWIAKLSKAGFIRMTVNQTTGARKIWIIDHAKNVMGGMTKLSGGYDKNVIHNSKTNTKRNTKDLFGDEPQKTVFSFEEEIKKLEDSDRRDLNIIALFMEYKAKALKPKITNSTQLSFFIKRYVKIAGQLMKAEYTDEQLVDAFDSVKRKFKDSQIDWTLETIGKELTK